MLLKKKKKRELRILGTPEDSETERPKLGLDRSLKAVVYARKKVKSRNLSNVND